MFEKIPTPELERMVEQLEGEEFQLSRTLAQREIASRAVAESVQFDREEVLDAIRNDITGIYDAMDGTKGSPEYPQDMRWLH